MSVGPSLSMVHSQPHLSQPYLESHVRQWDAENGGLGGLLLLRLRMLQLLLSNPVSFSQCCQGL